MNNRNSSNFEKMTKKSRLAFGEVDERRARNDKLHKPQRIGSAFDADYDPKTHKRIAQRKRSLNLDSLSFVE